MNDTWQTRTQCRSCAAQILVNLKAGKTDTPGLAVFYCPACGERRQVDHPAGYDPLSVTATKVEGQP
jgi:transcription elongation factor Elf1